jgi:hypothetical protein
MLKSRWRLVLAILHVALALSPCLWSQEPFSIELRVVNQSSHVIHRIYVSPSRNPKWGDNLLKGPLAARGTASLRLGGTCGIFDLRFVADEGVEYLDDEVELCDRDEVVTIGERGLAWSETPEP